jgi:hypothetical protein
MAKNEPKEAKNFIKAKAGPTLGFRTNDFFRGSSFAPKGKFNQKFSNSQFHTQHKGGS